MARRNAIVVFVTVLFLGLAASGLCFIAYAKRIKAGDVKKTKDGLCEYPGSPALALGILAAILVLIEQVVISASTGCFCCGIKKFPCNFCGIFGLLLFIISWLSFVITMIGMIFTAILNTGSYLLRTNNDSYDYNVDIRNNKDGCPVGNEALFYGSALWCLINLTLNLVAYATYLCGRKRHHKQHRGGYGNEQGIAMGQPSSAYV